MTVLTDEINNDPEHLGYSQYLPDSPGIIIDLLNKKLFSKIDSVSRNMFSIWAVKYGVRAQIEDFAVDVNNPLRSAALALKDLLQSADNRLDLSDPDIMTFVNLWPMSADAKTALITLGTAPASRAEVLGLAHVDVYDLIREGIV